VNVLRTSPPAADSRLAPHHFREQRAQVASVGNEVPMAAVIGDNDITRVQCADYPRGVGFLTDRGVRGASKHTTFEFLKHRLFKTADPAHSTVKCDFVHQAPAGQEQVKRQGIERHGSGAN